MWGIKANISISSGLIAIILSSCIDSYSQYRTIKVPMRDGIELTTDIYIPSKGQDKWPLILLRTPYSRNSQAGYGRFFSNHGYVVAIQDVRGRYDSQGDFELWSNERTDGYDAIEYLANKKWCNGKVGMAGGSYGGWVQLAAAVEKPPHLVTIAPSVTMADPSFNHVYPFGIFHLTQHLTAISIFENHKGQNLYRLKPGWRNHLDTLPIINLDKVLFGRECKSWRDHLIHKPFDPYWKKSDVLNDLENTNIPVLLIGGWYDFGGIGTLESYMHLSKSNNPYIKLLIGPWSHQNLGKSKLGEYDFGEHASLDLNSIKLEWFDYWMKGVGKKPAIDSLVKVFEVGPNRWLESNQYPPADSEKLRLYLTGKRSDDEVNAVRLLSITSQKDAFEFDTYTYNPADPTPYIWYDNIGDYDSITDARDDMIVYESEPFEQDYQVLGPVSATIFASTSAPDTDWVVYYFLVNDQEEIEPVIARGQVRASYRDRETGYQLLEEGVTYKYEINLWHNSFRIPSGYKIRVIVCSAAFPHFSRNLNTGMDNELETDFQSATQKIHYSKSHSSYIEFPVLKDIKIR